MNYLILVLYILVGQQRLAGLVINNFPRGCHEILETAVQVLFYSKIVNVNVLYPILR